MPTLQMYSFENYDLIMNLNQAFNIVILLKNYYVPSMYARHDELFSFEMDDKLVTSNYYIKLCLLLQYTLQYYTRAYLLHAIKSKIIV